MENLANLNSEAPQPAECPWARRKQMPMTNYLVSRNNTRETA